MDLQTWVSLCAVAGFGLAVLASLRSFRTALKGDIAGLRSELKGDIAGLRTELKDEIADQRAESRAGFAEVNRRLSVLEERSYDLVSRLPPPPAHSVSGT